MGIDRQSSGSVVMQDKHELRRMTLDVLSIFREVFGKELDPKLEWPTVKRWWVEHGFGVYEFRMFIEHEFKSEKSRQYLMKPGNLSLARMFDESRQDFILEVVRSLKDVRGALSKKPEKALQAPEKEEGVLYQPVQMSCCGQKVYRRFVKEVGNFRGSPFRWKEDSSSYGKHVCEELNN